MGSVVGHGHKGKDANKVASAAWREQQSMDHGGPLWGIAYTIPGVQFSLFCPPSGSRDWCKMLNKQPKRNVEMPLQPFYFGLWSGSQS